MRFHYLLRLLLALLLIFVLQKVVFMLYHSGMAEGVPFAECLAALWHGLRLDVATACYLLVLPAVVVLVSYLFRTFPLRKVMVPYYVIIAIVFSLAFAIDLILYGYWGSKPDANDLVYAAKPREALAGLPVWFTILGFIVLAAVVWACVMLLRWVTPKTLAFARTRWQRLSALLIIPVAGIIFLGMRGSVSESTANPSFAYFSSYPFCNHSALNPTFNMFHSLFKVQDLGAEFDVMSFQEEEQLIGDAYRPDPTVADTLLRTQRPNVLLVIWEGGGKGMVGDSTVAPNLHRLMKEGVYFSRCYANSYRTDRGLVSTLSGWPGLPTATIMKRPDLFHGLPSMASALSKVGYRTRITFGGDIDYTNMRQYFMETGFAEVNGSESFPSHLYSSAWGVPDGQVLNEGLLPDQKPFFSAVLTLSSHEPWEVDYRHFTDPRLNAFAYTDSCLGAFVRKLQASPLWDNLLVVILPDHGATFLDGQTPADTAVAAIPIVWAGGALARQGVVIDCLMNQSDLAATLMAQMGIDVAPFVLSRNVLGENYAQRRQFAVHSVKNQVNLITPQAATSYECVNHTFTPADSQDTRLLQALLQRYYRTTAKCN